MNQSILSNHNLVILPGCFASDAVSSEMEALRDAVERGEEMKIRDDGTIEMCIRDSASRFGTTPWRCSGRWSSGSPPTASACRWSSAGRRA